MSKKKIADAMRKTADKIDPPQRVKLWRKGIWLTAERIAIPIEQMEDSHLLNVARMLWRQAEAKSLLAEGLSILSIPAPRGEMALDAYMRGIDDMAEYGPSRTFEKHPFYPHLRDELAKRDLWREFDRTYEDPFNREVVDVSDSTFGSMEGASH